MLRNTPIILDIESSGFGPSSYPIEIGVVMSNARRLSVLVRPEPDWDHWDPAAEAVHGISRQILLQHGRAVNEVAAMLNTELQGKRTYSDGWVVDRPWLSKLFHAAGLRMAFELSPIEQLMSESQMLRWDDTKRRVLAEQRERRHRASVDAWVIQQTFLRSRLRDTG